MFHYSHIGPGRFRVIAPRQYENERAVCGISSDGKNLSKADVSVNIYAWMRAQQTGKPVELCCAIGDETVGGVPYKDIVEQARDYILNIGGFEKFAEWGLV